MMTKKTTAKDISNDLIKSSSKKRKIANEYFFKTGKGEYSAGDCFLGVSAGDIRKIAKKYYKNIHLLEIKKLLYSKYNEFRVCAVILLTHKYKENNNQKIIYDFYLSNINQINNWNIVDLSTPHIIGEYILKNKSEQRKITAFSKSKNLWKRRVSVLATWRQIKIGEFGMLLDVSKKLLNDDEDLIHKAVGWMLREAWKVDSKRIEKFILTNYKKVPRTTLRYAIEKMQEQKRKKFLNYSR